MNSDPINNIGDSNEIFDSVSRCVQELEIRVGISGSLYRGLLVSLFVVTLRVFIAQGRAQSCFILILVMVIITFGIATAAFVLTMYNISTQLQPMPMAEDLDPPFSCDDDTDPPYLRPLFMLQMLLVDSFTIYRTWLLYKRRYSVIFFPFICSITLFGSLLFNLIEPRNWVGAYITYVFNIPLSLILNLCCTVFITIRLVKMRFGSMEADGYRILQFFVLSGAIHNLVLFFFFVGLFAGWADGLTLVGPVAISCTAAIAFDFLVLQIALTKAFNSTHALVASEESNEDTPGDIYRTVERKSTSDSTPDKATETPLHDDFV
ncbi:hypothetical protein SISNIDRAFT_458402 [Sistotremastrum niveocremeum HHB9708]|uniref:Uncharacterized protein n=1 Tax=Sistotremastrum niveocremeum HHB9708 TaxID=1314777 RepID=A0A164QJN3_9AGAM|nr:hypothetical protein SISNIDRAFT_458402 [Sistotremastrum niveocremeum HHB9708]